MSEAATLLEKTLAAAQQAGADDAEVHLSESSHFSVVVRQGGIEELSQATTRSLHLRVFVGQRLARASASDLSEETLHGLVGRAVERARLANEDPFAGLPDEFPTPPPAAALGLYDPQVESTAPEEGIEMARETERIALSLDPRVQNSGGASFHRGRGQIWLGNTRGFRGDYRGTSTSLGLYLLGQEGAGNGQVSDYWHSASRQRAQLESPEQVARTAVERVRRHFGARKVATQEVPVIFEPVLAAELLSDIFGAVCGEAVYLRRSFLAGALGSRVAAEGVSIVDDGLRPGGLGSRPFDGEGVACRKTVVVENGVLHNYLCGTYSARKLGRRSTGNGAGNGEAPTNFYLAAGPHTPEVIIDSVAQGLYVTRLLGQGVNLVTGDYSRGAFGVWVEGGAFAYPVHEVTISNNLRRMLEGMEMVGQDLEFRHSFAAPTIKIAAMTVAGV
ncbi:MAG: TldD/PmbA family protein [Candidatus Acidiferrales bacterium]